MDLKKSWKVLDFRFFMGTIIHGVGFMPFWFRLPVPGLQPQRGNISLKFPVETRLKSESLEPLIGFLAFLVQKFQPKKLNLNKNTQNVFFSQILVILPFSRTAV